MSRARTSIRLSATLSATLSMCGALVLACGSRGPLDDTPELADAGAADVVTTDVVEEPAPVVDAGPPDAPREAGILQCGTCLVGTCSTEILGCIQSAPCRDTLLCVVQDCGGKVDLACLGKCATDTAATLKIFSIFQCVTKDCGPECGDLLGGLLGGGLPGGGGGGGKDGKDGKDGKAMTPIARAFASFPELASRPE
jgi:hypothetical protein